MSGTVADLFFWPDWQSDPCLRLCSFAAQGLWARLLCIAAESDRKGFILIRGQKPTADQLSRVCGGSSAEIESLVKEIVSNGVASTDHNGVVYSRRMVRDAKKRAASAKGGKKGGRTTYGTSKGIFTTQDATQEVTQATTQHPIPVSESSTVTKSRKKDTPSLRSVVLLPLVDGNEFPISESLVVEWRTAFPAVDVEQELLAMRTWSITNPTRRKTKSGILKFANLWLSKAQDRGGRGMGSGRVVPLRASPHVNLAMGAAMAISDDLEADRG